MAAAGDMPVVVGAEDLPRPLVVDAALRHREDARRAWPTSTGPCWGRSPRRRCRPRSMSRRRCSGSAPASWRSRSSPSSSSTRSRSGRWPSETRHFTPLASVITRGIRSRYLRVDARGPQVGGLVGVGVGGDDEVLLRITGPRAARPARVAGRLQAPEVGLVDGRARSCSCRSVLQCTSVNGDVGVVVGLEHRLHRRADRRRPAAGRRAGCRPCGRRRRAAARPAPRGTGRGLAAPGCTGCHARSQL